MATVYTRIRTIDDITLDISSVSLCLRFQTPREVIKVFSGATGVDDLDMDTEIEKCSSHSVTILYTKHLWIMDNSLLSDLTFKAGK